MNKRRSQPNQYLFSVLLRLKCASSSESGFIIFITIGMVLLLGFLWTASALITKVDTSRADATESSNTGFYGAEYGLNRRAQAVRSRFEGYNLPSGTPAENWQACLDEISSNNGSGDFECQTTTLTPSSPSRAAQRVTTLMRPAPNTPMRPNPSQITISTGEPFAGLSALEHRYSVDAVALKTHLLNGSSQILPSAILGLEFKSRLVPLFQFAVFYNDDADFTIPPDLTMNGRVHSNGNLYLNAATNNTLSINGQVSAAGVDLNGVPKTNPLRPLIRGEKSNESQQCTGRVRIFRTTSNNFQNLNCSGNARTRYASNTTTPSSIPAWGENIQLTVPRLTVPPAGDFTPTPGSLYWDNADLRLVLNVTDDDAKPSRTRVVNIEVQNSNGIQNATATAALNSCSALDSTGNAITTNLTGSQPGLTAASLNIINNTANRFRIGDAVIVGNDWDSNFVINQNPDDSMVGANRGHTVFLSGSTLYLRQALGDSNGTITGVRPSSGAFVRKAVVSSSDSFYNFREKYDRNGTVVTGGDRGQYIRMLNVDMRQLLNCAHNQPNLMGGKALNDTTEGGLVWYMTVKDNTGNTNNFRKYGIRLYNGRSLRSTIAAAPEIAGLTVVSNQAVYVQGDYNLKDDAITVPSMQTVAADDPETNGITETWRPAAILADSINILSNRWRLDNWNGTAYNNSNLPASQDDPQGYTCLAITPPCSSAANPPNRLRPAPTTTWVNAGFLAGTVSPANEGSPGTGGINNYPRFHEAWAGVPFNYRGSFVSLFQPLYSVAPFCGSANVPNCNIYTAPFRNWDYERTAGVNNVGFNDAANLPPLTPRAVFLRQEVFRRSYDRASLDLVPNPFAFLPSPSFNFGLALPSQR